MRGLAVPRPTRRTAVVVPAGLLLLHLSGVRDDAWLLLLAALLLALPVVAFVLLPRVELDRDAGGRWVGVCWEGPTRVRAGDEVRHAVHVHAPDGAGLPELRAECLRAASSSLGRITGRGGVEAVLDAVFREFCIGK